MAGSSLAQPRERRANTRWPQRFDSTAPIPADAPLERFVHLPSASPGSAPVVAENCWRRHGCGGPARRRLGGPPDTPQLH